MCRTAYLDSCFFPSVSGPLALERYGLEKAKCWRQWLVKLRKGETELHTGMGERHKESPTKNLILLLEKIAESFQ